MRYLAVVCAHLNGSGGELRASGVCLGFVWVLAVTKSDAQSQELVIWIMKYCLYLKQWCLWRSRFILAVVGKL